MSGLVKNETELALIETARRVLPAGTFGNFSGDIVIREGRGGRVWDESGNEYVDFLLGSGPMFVGHAHPEVTEAVLTQVPKGTRSEERRVGTECVRTCSTRWSP